MVGVSTPINLRDRQPLSTITYSLKEKPTSNFHLLKPPPLPLLFSFSEVRSFPERIFFLCFISRLVFLAS